MNNISRTSTAKIPKLSWIIRADNHQYTNIYKYLKCLSDYWECDIVSLIPLFLLLKHYISRLGVLQTYSSQNITENTTI